MVQKTLEEVKKLVFPEIKKYLKDPVYPKEFKIPAGFKKEASDFWKINCVYPKRKGKYLRPALVLLTAQALGLSAKKAVKTAAAMQLSEEWILIHDDIEDNSDKRRGKDTLHKIYGPELAINAGDSLHIIMWKIVNDIGSKKISEEFYKMLLRTTLGQGVEQIWTNKKVKMSDDRYFFVADSKSAYYSIAGPMRLGAIIAGANEKQIVKITRYGLHLGRCFQLIDDILDIRQDKKEGKSTLAVEKGIEYARRMAQIEKNKAKKIFANELGFLSHNPARQKLGEIADFIFERNF